LLLGLALVACSGKNHISGDDVGQDTDMPRDMVETMDPAGDPISESDAVHDSTMEPDTEAHDGIEDLPSGDCELPCDEYLCEFFPGRVTARSEPDRWTVHGFSESNIDADPLSWVIIQSWQWEGGPMGPGTTTISSWIPESECNLCIYFWQDCSIPGCAHLYMADQATLTITDITIGMAGSIDAVLSNVVFFEWDLGSDVLVPGGRTFCIDRWEISTEFD
jgi:hypothetical protein